MNNYWFDGSPVLTHYYNALSILFPAWEEAFAHVARHRKKDVSDPELLARMDKFIAQEIAHGKAHTKHNVRYGLSDSANDQMKLAQVVLRRPQAKAWLAAMVSIEHIAACVSRDFLKTHGYKRDSGFTLFRWHSVEELEHKSLALDVWNHLGYDTVTLHAVARSNFVYVWKFILGYTLDNLRKENQLWRLRTIFDGTKLFGALVFRVWIPYLRVFRQRFHPDHVDDTALIRSYT